MYVDPKSGEVVLTHHSELKRIPDYRDHGFDELSPISDWMKTFFKNHDNASFTETKTDGSESQDPKNYIFINNVNRVLEGVHYSDIEIEAGYFDFQDGQKVPVAQITLIKYVKSNLLTLKTASSYGQLTDDVFRPLSDLVDGPYLKL